MNSLPSATDHGYKTDTGWTTSGGRRLFRRHVRPTTEAIARVLILHGYGDHSGRYLHFMQWLADHAIASDAFDFQGHGQSEGKRGYVQRWDDYLADLQAVLKDAQSHAEQIGTGTLPLFVFGHSHGGLIAAAAGTDGILADGGVRGVVLSAPYLQPVEQLSPLWRGIAVVTNVVAPSLQVANGLSGDMMSSDPAMVEESRADPLLLKSATPRWYASTLARQKKLMAAADQFTLPLLAMAGSEDRIAAASATQQFVAQTRSPDKAFISLTGQKHEILRELKRVKTFGAILKWITERV